MESGLLSVFAAVARCGGVTKASAALHTVPSNVTMRIKQLELALGVTLFERHSRGMVLTNAGAQLLPYAARIENLLVEARYAVTDPSTPSGKLTIGAMETTAALRLPPVLLRYTRTFPEVDVILRTGTSSDLTKDVIDYRLDGALVAGPVELSELRSEPVVSEDLVLVSASRYTSFLDAVRFPANAIGMPSDVPKAIVFRSGCSYRRRLENLLAEHGVAHLRIMELGTLDGILGCVASGLGVTLLPSGVVEKAVRSHEVRGHDLPEGHSGRVDTVFVSRADAFCSAALKEFIGMMKV